MNLNDRQSTVNKIYAALREIDSYKYGLVAKEVLKIQASMLVFLKEKCTPADKNFSREDSYKSYLLDGIWSQVSSYWMGLVDSLPPFSAMYDTLKELNPTGSECEKVLDALLDKRRQEYDDPTPSEELAELAIRLLDYKGGVVYNPEAGYGTLGLLMDIGDNYFGRTGSDTQWSIGVARMLLRDKLPSRNYVCDSIRPLEACAYERYIEIFRLDLNIDSAFSNLSKEGKAIFITPAGLLFSHRERAARERLIEQNVLDMVIALPASTLKGTSVGVAILVCKQGRSEDDPVTLLDARGGQYAFKDARSVTLEVNKILSELQNPESNDRIEVVPDEIKEAGYDLNPVTYLPLDEDIPEGYEVSKLRDLIITDEPRREGLMRNRFETVRNERIVRPSDLEVNLTEFHISPDQIPVNTDSNGRRCILLEQSCILVSPRNRHISAAYYHYQKGDHLYADSVLTIIKVDENRIDPEYLVFKIRSSELMRGTSSVSRFIFDLPIAYPSLAEQRKIVQDTIKANKLTKIRELGLTEEVQRLKNEYKTLIRTKKHNLGTVRGNISATVRQLQKQAEKANQEGEIDIKALLNRVNRLVDYWKDLDGRLDRIADENKFKEAEEFSFDEFFKNIEANRPLSNYTLSYNLDKATFDSADAKFAINVNPDDFRQVVENIISNAEKHGFRDSQREDYHINISVYYEECETGEQRVCFLFENNGYPAPEMTNAQFGMSGWHAEVKGSKGEGLGGAYISEMTRHFGGGYEAPQSVMDEVGEYSKTRVLIYFPAIIDFNETISVMKQYAFDTIYDIIYTHLKHEEYNINTGFDITFDPELEVYECPMQDYGYELNDDDSIYIDENGRPCHSNPPEDIHWINDITMLDENGKRVVNADYIRKIVDRMFSRDKERLCFI